MKEKSIYRLRIFISICMVAIFAALVVWLIFGLGRADSVTAEQKLNNVKQSVVNGAVLCYSVEGFYPESIDYLEEYYGVTYDTGKYLVHYRYVSADIPPSVMVYENDNN